MFLDLTTGALPLEKKNLDFVIDQQVTGAVTRWQQRIKDVSYLAFGLRDFANVDLHYQQWNILAVRKTFSLWHYI